MLGIAGDSGSGRATVAGGVTKILGRRGVTPIRLDDYHRYSRAERRRLGLTALDPQATDLDSACAHLHTLRMGGTILKPIYDHRDGSLAGCEKVTAQGLIVTHGLLTLASAELAALFDLSVFLDPDEQLRQRWKMARDTIQRGYSPAEVEEQLALSRAAAERFVLPQRSRAAIVVRYYAHEHTPDDDQLGALVTLRRNRLPLDITPMLQLASQYCPALRLRRVQDTEGPADLLVIESAITPQQTSMVAELLWPLLSTAGERLPAGAGDYLDGARTRHSDSLALVQLIIACQLAAVTGNRKQ